jgi:hypothetical protein
MGGVGAPLHTPSGERLILRVFPEHSLLLQAIPIGGKYEVEHREEGECCEKQSHGVAKGFIHRSVSQRVAVHPDSDTSYQ